MEKIVTKSRSFGSMDIYINSLVARLVAGENILVSTKGINDIVKHLQLKRCFVKVIPQYNSRGMGLDYSNQKPSSYLLKMTEASSKIIEDIVITPEAMEKALGKDEGSIDMIDRFEKIYTTGIDPASNTGSSTCIITKAKSQTLFGTDTPPEIYSNRILKEMKEYEPRIVRKDSKAWRVYRKAIRARKYDLANRIADKYHLWPKDDDLTTSIGFALLNKPVKE